MGRGYPQTTFPLKMPDSIAAFLFRHQWRGAMRFHRIFCQGRRLRARTKHGLALSLSPHEYIDGLILKYGYYEEEVLEAVRSVLRPGDCFWDVGSNLGLHALTVARLHPDVEVYAFEPNPAMAQLIQTAISFNQARVQFREWALDSQKGTARFYLYEGNAGMSGFHNWDADPDLASIEVRTVTGDDLVAEQGIREPQVVKIDVEGNEFRTLQGMRRLLENRSLRAVVFEDTREPGPAKELLREAGFTVQPLARKESTHHVLENYLARRSF
jgi:FkbM family methyltransferase